MKRRLSLFFTLIILLDGQARAQLARNPKLSPADLESAQAETLAAGGTAAELIYAARLDAVQKGSFDSLIVIYAKSAKKGKDYFAVLLREGQKYPLVCDKQGRALKSGDRYSRIGLKHEEGKSPILRLIGEMTDPVKGDQQRNLDFRFTGEKFELENQSVVPIAK